MDVIEENLDNIILPPPLKRAAVGELQPTLGGQLLRESFAFSNVSDDIVEGYNDVVYNQIPARLRIPFYDNGVLKLWIDDLRYLPPSIHVEGGEMANMFPIYARTMGRTYESVMQCRVFAERTTSRGVERGESDLFNLGTIPVMIGSGLDNIVGLRATDREKIDLYGECPDDAQGYFIIKGVEYVVMIQQQLRYNTLLVMPRRNPTENSRYTMSAQLKSFTLKKNYVMNIEANRRGVITMRTDNIPKRDDGSTGGGINAYFIYRILAPLVYSNNRAVTEAIVSLVPRDDWRAPVRSFLAATEQIPFDTSYSFINRANFTEASRTMTLAQKVTFIRTLILREMFPHVDPGRVTAKLTLLSLSILQYVYVEVGIREPNDIDSWSSSQTTSPGMNIYMLFNQIWNNIVRPAEKLYSSIENVHTTITVSDVVVMLQDAMKNASFNKMFTEGFRKHSFKIRNQQETDNATQVLIRKSTLAAKVHVNRIVIRSQGRGKMINKRQVHMSQIGYVCPSDSQEGDKCGLTKSKAVTARISTGRDRGVIRELLSEYLSEERVGGMRPILLDYDLLGWGNAAQIVRVMRGVRRGDIGLRDVAVIYDDTAVHILSLAGRITRPLLVVEDGQLVIDKLALWGKPFEELLRRGAVEYLDPWEQEGSLVAAEVNGARDGVLRQTLIAERLEKIRGGAQESELRRNYRREMFTHCELDPSAILGIGASLIPLANHNQGPRNSYQCNMSYQALGVYAGNHYYRFDSHAKVLAFPSRPVMESHLTDIFGLREAPQGQMVSIAIMPFRGLNQEDAIIVNKQSVERGLFASVVYRTEILELQSPGDMLGYPLDYLSVTAKRTPNVYRNIDPEGLPIYNRVMHEGDCLVGAVRKIEGATAAESRFEDISLYADRDWEGAIIERVEMGVNGDNHRVVVVKSRRFKYFEQGDKLASRHAQKSIGVIVPAEDLPWSSVTGTVPDLIMNALAIPSRMTMGHIFEILASKFGAMAAQRINGSSWGDFNIDAFKRQLVTFGFSSSGREQMFDGMTGEQIAADVFVGPCYYQALYHQVTDKIQARQTGMLNRATKQAISGKSRGGGIKFGTMENAALVAHGAVHAVVDRLSSSCGTTPVITCTQCGVIVSKTVKMYNAETVICPSCESPNTLGRCNLRPTALHVTDYLTAAGLQTIIRPAQ